MYGAAARKTHPIPTKRELKDALAHIGATIRQESLKSLTLARTMRETFGRSDASGVWDWRMAYDKMQAATVAEVCREHHVDDATLAATLASRLLSETRRSEQQIRLQQFSTPLHYAALAVHAAGIRKGECVLEPSAGTR